MSNEDELIKRLSRISLEEMQDLYFACGFLGPAHEITISGELYLIYQDELDVLSVNHWTLEDFLDAGGIIF